MAMANLNDQHPDGPSPERAAALAAIDADYPGWHAWEGVIAGIMYARRVRTSPPVVVRSVTVEELRAEVHRAEQQYRETGHYR